jgi:heme/copper-type cytochrome/quinol oxidase subunit 4
MKTLKTLCLLTLIVIAFIFNSCGSSTSFSKRKYRKGVFKQHSVRVKRDKSRSKETYYTNKSANIIDDLNEKPVVIQNAEPLLTDTLLKNEFTQELNETIELIRIHPKDKKTQVKDKRQTIKSKENVREMRNPGRTQLSDASLATGIISLIILIILFALTICFFLTSLIGISLVAIIVCAFILFILNLTLFIIILKKKNSYPKNEKKNIKRSMIPVIIAMAIAGGILVLIMLAFLLPSIFGALYDL